METSPITAQPSTLMPNQPARQPIERVLIKLGEILTKDELHVPWMNMKTVAKQCQKHRSQLSKVAFACSFNAREMESQAMELFEASNELVTEKVKITYRTEPKERMCRNDNLQELQLAFHKFDPANDHINP